MGWLGGLDVGTASVVTVGVTAGEGDPEGVVVGALVDVAAGDAVGVGIGVFVVLEVSVGVLVETGEGDPVTPGDGLGVGVFSDSSLHPAKRPTDTTKPAASNHLYVCFMKRVVS